MAATMRIPTEFTAIDSFTRVVKTMTAGVGNFAKSAGAAVQRVNTKIDNSFSKLSNLSQLLLGLSFGAIFAGAVQDLKDYDDAIASFRVIVSDLTDKEFASYRMAVNDVAKDTKKSTIVVAQSFEKIAGLNADLAKTSAGLSEVSKQAIILSKASGADETENLVGIMNQFSLSAKDAARVSNVLAAGQAVGASTIAQSAEAYKNFGSVAKGANITLEQSQGLIQTLGKYSLFGAEAGTKLRGVTLQLQKAGLGYKSGQFQINDALLDATKKMDKLRTAKQKDAFLTKLFGAENITAGKILLTNIKTYQDFTKGVTDTNAAQEQADIKANTLTNRINELKDSFTNLLTTNEQTNGVLGVTKNIMIYLADNIDVVVGVALSLVGAYVAMKVALIATNIATFAASVAMGVYGAVTGTASIAIGQNTVALTAYRVVQGIMTAGTWLATAAMTAFGVAVNLGLWPILAIIAAIAAIIAIFYYWDEICAWFSTQWEMFTGLIGAAWDAVVSWFTDFSFKDFFMSIGQSIINFMLWPLKKVLELVAMIPGGIGDAAQMGLDKLNQMSNLSVMLGTDNQQVESPEVVNAQNSQTNRVSGGIDVNIRDKGNNVESTSQSGNIFIPINLSSTQGAF